ncbi:hypothetical protein [Hansschlegelia zhihuaiae]|uniref:Cupin domain-containing protein n=1 Tax=Hansschlegelia zhihuaiae TaxID=405005 RepID=A0A4Q0MFL2_9HYPH|nr:hypothetical protein [Hansschlegelia zhihuaiae]RXF72085.1 hypothetical protein EK403_14850 [Hansschlegelia zhihuaiae]
MRLPRFIVGWLCDALIGSVAARRRPDVTIGVRTATDYARPGSRLPAGEEPYLERWWVIPRNRWFNVYLHTIHRSDDDRALHDHPWANMSIVLAGGYLEHRHGQPPAERRPGDVVLRGATAAHRLEILDPRPCWTLFVTGRITRLWGFHCPRGWIPHTNFNARDELGLTQGCGEDQEVRP